MVPFLSAVLYLSLCAGPDVPVAQQAATSRPADAVAGSPIVPAPLPTPRPAEPETPAAVTPAAEPRPPIQQVIRIEVDPRVLPLHLEAITPLFATPAVAGASAPIAPATPAAVSGAAPNPAATPISLQFDFAPAPGAGGQAKSSPIVGILRAANAAQADPATVDAAIHEALGRLRTLLTDETRRVIAKLEASRARARDVVEAKRKKSEELLAKRAAVLAQWNVRAISESLPRLETDLRAADVEKARVTSELAGRRARQVKLTAELARVNQSVEKAAETDEASLALARVVELRKATLVRLRKMCSTGNASPNEQQQAETDLALAEADVARQRNNALQQARGNEVTQLRAMLTQVNIEIPDLEAQLAAVEERVKDLRASIAAIEEVTTKVDRSIVAAETELQGAEKALAELAAEIDGIREADVSVLGQN